MHERTRTRNRYAAAVRRSGLVLLLAGAAVSCGLRPGTRAQTTGLPSVATPGAVPDSVFRQLMGALTEPGGFFDTDNLISNERSYLHVIDVLAEHDVAGGAYIGVGPDQNFSYIAQVRPRIAFIMDIRRDNALQHLLLKSILANAPTRIEYLAMLFGREPPPNPATWVDRPIDELVAYIDDRPADAEVTRRNELLIERSLDGLAVASSETDRATIRRFHRAFIRAGLGLQFTSAGRAPQPYYPTFRQLALERDLAGERVGYLASAERFGVVRELSNANRIIPLVGDLSGDSALARLGDYLTEIDVPVSAFYTSNVEFYLVRSRTFDRFADNLTHLPITEGSVIIRSVFGRTFFGRHPLAVPGYASTQLMQTIRSLITDQAAGGYSNYSDLVTRRAVTREP